MSARTQVQQVLSATVHSLDGIEKPALAEIMTVLHRAQEEVQRDLTAWLRKHPGGTTFTAQRYRNALAVLDAAIRKGGDMGGTIEHSFKRTAKRLGPLSYANIHREWKAFSQIFEGSVQPLPIDEAIIIARGNKLLWPRFERSASKYAGEVGERARRELAISHARGETVDELTNRLFKRMPAVFKGERWDAERLARSESHRAYDEFHKQGIREALAEDDKIRERIDAAHDGRLCPDCAALDGQVYEVGKGPMLPFHPCCRCCRTIWRESWASFANHSSVETLRRAA
jgi:SPP1 gp7 family putative phage head morphogenesis protein